MTRTTLAIVARTFNIGSVIFEVFYVFTVLFICVIKKKIKFIMSQKMFIFVYKF